MSLGEKEKLFISATTSLKPGIDEQEKTSEEIEENTHTSRDYAKQSCLVIQRRSEQQAGRVAWKTEATPTK